MEEQRAHGKGLKHSFIYRVGHTLSACHIPLVFTCLGLTLHLYFEREKKKSRKITMNWVGSLLLVYSVNLLQYEFKARSDRPLN